VVLREDRVTARTAVGYGRHSRPKPVGARFRLPGFRFSGAAMAMSTVVGISVATTWLVSEQQNVGRQPGVSNVGASPPLPSADGSGHPVPVAAASATATPTIGPRALNTPVTPVRHTASSSPVPAGPAPSSPTASASPSPSPSAPSSAPSGSPGSTPAPFGPTGGPTGRPTEALPTEAMAGEGIRELLGPSGTRHTLALAVGEPLTALQVELRLARPEALPGTTPWSTLPGAVVTVTQEHGTLVYRFTVPAGLDVQPGEYVFGVRGARCPAPGRERAAQEAWAASAFGLRRPRALAVRGIFG